MNLNNLSKKVHDSVIEGLFFDDIEHTLRLFIKIDYEIRYELMFKEVVEFRTIDFGMQNLISKMINYQKDNFCHNEILELLKWVSSNSDSSTYWSNEELINISEKLNQMN